MPEREPGGAPSRRADVGAHAEIGRRPAHIGYDEVVTAGQPLGADETRRRSRQDGLDGPHRNPLGQSEGAVALDDHQWAIDCEIPHHALDGRDEAGDAPDEAGIEDGSEGAARRIER